MSSGSYKDSFCISVLDCSITALSRFVVSARAIHAGIVDEICGAGDFLEFQGGVVCNLKPIDEPLAAFVEIGQATSAEYALAFVADAIFESCVVIAVLLFTDAEEATVLSTKLGS